MSMPEFRFLADEGCDFSVVRALREAGFDVVAVCEIVSRSNDRDILKLSHAENRVLLTEDKDFAYKLSPVVGPVMSQNAVSFLTILSDRKRVVSLAIYRCTSTSLIP
jgi:uncharacterized protein with PIN domain